MTIYLQMVGGRPNSRYFPVSMGIFEFMLIDHGVKGHWVTTPTLSLVQSSL